MEKSSELEAHLIDSVLGVK